MVATGVVAITLIGIVGISIGKYSGQSPVNIGIVSDKVTALGEGINSGFTFLQDNFKEVLNYRKNAQQLEKLENENKKLTAKVTDLSNKLYKADSLEELKKSLNFVDEKYKAKSISTSVVGKGDGNWYTSFVIGAGKNSGVKKESIVVNGKGLVGIVYDVSDDYSKAVSILDTKSSVSFKLLKDYNSKGVITQNTNIDDKKAYSEKGYLQGYMFDSSYDVVQGDIIVTSGLGLYPEGIPIGEVHKVVEDKNKSLKYVILKPYADLKNINDVMIIEPRNIG